MDALGDILTGNVDEDFVEYFVFPDLTAFLPPNASVQESEEKLNELLYTLNAEAVNLMDEYLWHKEAFALRLSPGNQYFHGLTRFGESVDDEWFIVHILQQLTLLFPKLVVRVFDNDGEFLLIEAAQFLPRWAESDEKCSQRVYIYEGKVHLIPRSEMKETNGAKESVFTGTPDMIEAVKTIREEMTMTIANDGIQKAIQDRIGIYPEKMLKNFQHANLVLPPRLVVILKQRPDWVPYAVQAFYNRDPIDMQTARFMKNFKPGDSLVKSRVRFTRTLYAMLSKQDYRPDPKTGWGFPRPTSNEFKGHSLGAKLTTGFEILLSMGKKKSENGEPTSYFSTRAWSQYEEKLKKTGYYKEFLEGSKPYKELEERAKIFFADNLTNGETSHPAEAIDNIVHEMRQLMNTLPVDFEKLKKEGASLPSEDDDAWMEVKLDDLETLLEEQFKTKITDQKLDQIPDKLKEFMNKLSEFDGVDDPAPTLGGYFSNPVNGEGDQEGDIELIDFRANDFVSAMDKLLVELGKPDRDWEPSDDDSFSDEEKANLEDIKRMHDFKKDSKIHQLMGQMDEELAGTEVGKTFSSDPDPGPSTSAAARARIEELDQFDDEVRPVDIDMNALTNMLESFHNQDGPAGPASNLLRGMGFDITKAKK